MRPRHHRPVTTLAHLGRFGPGKHVIETPAGEVLGRLLIDPADPLSQG